tara:strand:+ start:18978 stop:19358 length:381 start_codon:yes stop_codon:yes gene_type:complete
MGAVKDFAEPVRNSISQLENEISDLEKQLEGVDEIYAQMRTKKKQIALLQKTMAQLDGSGPTATGTNRPRGQNLKDIQGFLSEKKEACTVREISEGTGINIPSVRFTLGRHEVFVKDQGNTWTTAD